MNKVKELITEVAKARNTFLTLIDHIAEAQACMRSVEGEWNIIDITEHLYWAEQGAILGMWKILYAIREGKAVRTMESDHKEWPVEKLIAATWKEKEQVPAISAPRLGGTLIFWRYSLAGLQQLLEAFGKDLQENELRLLAHPHAISGNMDFQQRLEFLSFHIQRHQQQVQKIIDTFN